MESGNVVEYIDRQKIMCAVVLEVKKPKLRLLTENNREVKLSSNRLLHHCENRLDLGMGRDRVVTALKEMAVRRENLIAKINIKELWEILNTEREWIDLPTMTDFCFPDGRTCDHQSAVLRAFFKDRLYFKFDLDRFFPHTENRVKMIAAQLKEEARKNRIIEQGGRWLKTVLKEKHPLTDGPPTPETIDYIDILKTVYLFGKESRDYALCKALLARADIHTEEMIFQILVKLEVWDEDENVDLHRYEIPTDFPKAVIKETNGASAGVPTDFSGRTDLSDLPLMTIDGQSTQDFDDALSLEKTPDHIRLGIHIADVGHFVKKGDAVDQEALVRGSSIYMPDQKISMIPEQLAEGLCSLKAKQLRPAISLMATLDSNAEVVGTELFPSIIRVKHQLTYYDVDLTADENPDILLLRRLAHKLHEKRLAQGAVHISLPDVTIWIDANGEPTVKKMDRESPGRFLISEMMILANRLMAEILVKHNIPAVYRSQPGPRERLYKNNEGTLFQNWMQRKHLSRFILAHEPDHHSGLGLDAYVTATSPIRKYFDLATQRQLRAALDLEKPYTAEEIDQMIQSLEVPMSRVARIQYKRNRYWLLKYLEKMVGRKEEAIVLCRRRNNYAVLLTAYMIECNLPLSSGIDLKPEDLVQVTIQHVNARKDVISIYLG